MIPPSSEYYSIALTSSESLKMLVGSHAFPKQEKPYIQERRKILQAVMGADITASELKQAYKQDQGDSSNGKKGRQKKGKGKGKNQQQQQGGGGGGGGANQDRGRTTSPSGRDRPRSPSPSKAHKE